VSSSLAAGRTGSVTTAAALKKGHAAKAAEGAREAAASTAPRAVRGHAGASAASAQPPRRDKQDTGGGVFEGVAVSVDVAVGRADSEARDVAEGDAEEDREGGAERVFAFTVTVPPPNVTEAQPVAVGKVEAVREVVVVEEPLPGRVRVVRGEGEGGALGAVVALFTVVALREGMQQCVCEGETL